MKKFLLVLLMLLTMGISAFAQDPVTITIGTGTSETYSLPFDNFYKNTWTEMIYPADEISMAGTISSISFQVSAVPSSADMFSTVTIYMGTTEDDEHATTSSWLPFTELTEVYTATNMPLPTVIGWQTIVLNTPFIYDGSENLVIVISKTMSAYNSALKYKYTTSTAGYSSLYRQSDSDVSYANHPGTATGTRSTMLPNLQISITPGEDFCLPVRNLSVTEVLEDEATIYWSAPENANGYILEYKAVGEDWESGEVYTVYPTDTFYNITGLDPNTHYNVRVAHVCSSENSSWKNLTFKTECSDLSVSLEQPYIEGFENYNTYSFPDCWTRISGYSTTSYDYPYINNSTTAYNGGGYLYMYNNSSSPIVVALPHFLEDIYTLRLNFWMKPVGTTADYGRVEVGVMSDVNNPSTFVLVKSWTAQNIGSTAWQNYTVDFDTISATPTDHIVIRRYVTGSSTYGWYFDDIKVMPIPACEAPTELSCVGTTPYSVDLSWNPGEESNFTIYYRVEGDTEYYSVNNISLDLEEGIYTLTDLIPATSYEWYVSSLCNDGTETASFLSTFKTECLPISVASEPYFEDFEDYTTYSFPDCWTRISGYSTTSYDYPYINNNNSNAHSGTGYLYAYNDVSNPIIVALPQFTEDVNTLRLSFWMKPTGTTNYYGRVEVGVMTNLADTSTFTLVNSWTAVEIGSTTWTKYIVDFDNITSTGNDFIVIRRFITEGTSTYAWYFDDVKVMPIPTCEAPTELSYVGATSSSVDLFWNPGEESVFTVYYRPVDETEYSSVSNVTLGPDSTYTLTNLTSSTNYVWYVSALCVDGSLSPSDPSAFTTTMEPEVLPYTTDFSEGADQNWLLNNGSCVNYWVMGTIPDTTISALYITNNGTDPAYTITSTSIVTASKLFTVGEDTQFQISFDVLVGGESSFDYIKLFFAPATENYLAATSAPSWAANSYSTYAFDFTDYMSASTSTSSIAYKFNLTGGNVVHIDAIMSNPNPEPDVNSTAQVVFVWKNDPSGGTQPGAIISNVTVAPVVCPVPENLAVSNITATTADISWGVNNAESYTLEYGTHGFTLGEGTVVTVSGSNETTITDLTPVTEYDLYVKSNCSDGSESVNAFISFTTACVGITTLPQTWTFDDNLVAGTTSYPLPACWDRIVTAPSTQYPYAYNSSTYAHSGSRSLYFYNYYPDAIGILPNIDPDVLDIQNLQLSFYARFGSSSTSYIRLDVGVMTDPAVDSTFTLVQSVPLTTSYTSDPILVSFANYTGSGNYIAFRNTSVSSTTSSTYIYIDDVTLEEAPDCSKALYLDATVNAFSADLTWMATGEDFDIYYKAATDDDYTLVTDVTLVDGVFTLTGLTASTVYTWYVVTNCDDTVYTSNTATFTTTCAPVMAPFIETFNASNTVPACWERLTGLASSAFAGTAPTTTTSGWLFTNINVFGEYHPKVNIYGTTCKYWLVTPEIDLTNLSNPALTFNLALTDFGNANPIEDTLEQQDDKFMVIISTDNGNTWSASNATVWSNDATADYVYNQISYTGEEVVISLEDYAGQTIRIAFYAESTTSGGDNDLHIDNVAVDEAPHCSAPSQLTISQITQTSAYVQWTETGEATSWVLEYDTTGFVQGTGNIVMATGDPFTTLTGLTPQTTYDVYVRAECSDGGNSNAASTSFMTACAALDELPYTWNFDNIGTGTSVHPECWTCSNTYSSTQYPYVYGTNPYSGNANLYFYSSSTTYSLAVLPMVDVDLNPINTLQVSFMMRSATPSSVRMVVGLMTDPGDITTFEAIDTVYNSVANTYEYREVMFGDYTGDASYVALKMINLSSSTYANVDDVTLDFIPTCPRPTHLAVTDNTMNSITLTWDDITASSWEIAYGPTGFDPNSDTATIVTANIIPFEVLGLNSSSTYQFYVRAICPGNEYSPWSLSVVGSTECDLVTLPYTENFDSYITSSTYSDANGIAPTCWMTYSTNTTYGAPHIVSNGTYWYHHSGTNSMIFTCGSAGSDAYAALPTFTDQLNSLKLTFWRAMESTSSGTLTVGYVTNLNNLSGSFVSIATIPSVSSTSGDTISVNFALASVPAEGNICFHWNYSSSFYSCCIDDIVVISGDAPVVTDPTVVTNAATNIDMNSATLNATITNPDGVNITAKGFEWKATNGGTYTAIAGTGTGNTFTANLTGLTLNTSYTFKAFITYNGTTVYGTEKQFTTHTVGIDNLNLSQNISLMPNPADNYIDLRVNDNVEVKEAVVYNAFGQMLQTVQLTNNHARIDLSDMAAGMYFVRVNGDNMTATKKFIKK